MGSVRVLVYRGASRKLQRLLRRHGDKVLLVVVVVEFDSPGQAGALAKAYGGEDLDSILRLAGGARDG